MSTYLPTNQCTLSKSTWDLFLPRSQSTISSTILPPTSIHCTLYRQKPRIYEPQHFDIYTYNLTLRPSDPPTLRPHPLRPLFHPRPFPTHVHSPSLSPSLAQTKADDIRPNRRESQVQVEMEPRGQPAIAIQPTRLPACLQACLLCLPCTLPAELGRPEDPCRYRYRHSHIYLVVFLLFHITKNMNLLFLHSTDLAPPSPLRFLESPD